MAQAPHTRTGAELEKGTFCQTHTNPSPQQGKQALSQALRADSGYSDSFSMPLWETYFCALHGSLKSTTCSQRAAFHLARWEEALRGQRVMDRLSCVWPKIKGPGTEPDRAFQEWTHCRFQLDEAFSPTSFLVVFISLCGQTAFGIPLPRGTICDNRQGCSWNISEGSELLLLVKQCVLFIYKCITSYLFVDLPMGELRGFPSAWAFAGPLGSSPSRFFLRTLRENGAGFPP